MSGKIIGSFERVVDFNKKVHNEWKTAKEKIDDLKKKEKTNVDSSLGRTKTDNDQDDSVHWVY